MTKSHSATRTPMSVPAAARIQSATARSTGGTVTKSSFAATAQSAAAQNGSGKSVSKK